MKAIFFSFLNDANEFWFSHGSLKLEVLVNGSRMLPYVLGGGITGCLCATHPLLPPTHPQATLENLQSCIVKSDFCYFIY